MVEVDAYVEVFMIPIGFMVAAPLPGRVHFCDIALDLAAIFAVAAYVAVDFCAVGFKAAMAVIAPIPVGASCAADSQNEPAGQYARHHHAAPQFIFHHGHLRDN